MWPLASVDAVVELTQVTYRTFVMDIVQCARIQVELRPAFVV
jgi:hypothetical protein